MPQLPAFNSNSSQGLNCSSPLINSLHYTNSQASSHLTPTSYSSHCHLKTLLSCNHSCSSLYILGTDCIENSTPNSSSIVVLRCYFTDCIQNTTSKVLHCRVLRICCGHYLATVVVYRAVTYQQLLYNCLFHGHCLATSLHATIFYCAKALGVFRPLISSFITE
jgi:hypothetical protein